MSVEKRAEEQVDMKMKMEMVERTLLELGTELFGLKGTVTKVRDSHEQLLGVLKGLKQLLDEKGLITLEDFDAAVDLGQALERFNSQSEHGAYVEMERLKKTNH
jgi:hypothetical protein